jgi:TolB-like protein/DNA-binding winged helix-turn-helix (wHTH) protein/Tfp pilus assembly protein PilF
MKRRSGDIVEFPPFAFTLVSGELRKGGRKLKLHPQPAKVLALLLQTPGEVVRREDIQKQVWGDDTYVAFDLGINSCIRQIRTALGDDAEEPRYVQTVTREGYRFIAPVEPSSPEEQDSPPPNPERKRRYPVVLLGSAAVAVLALGGFLAVRLFVDRGTAPAAVDSIAVLPLENLSGNPDEAYFADGMTEALITELAKIDALKVISRTTVMQYKDAEKSLPEIAGELDVDVVVEGSVVRVDDRVRFTLQLIEGRTDRNLWASSYDRDARDILSLQREIALAVVSEIQVKLSPEERRLLEETRSRNPGAHDLYLKGLYTFHEAVNRNHLAERVELHHKSFDSFKEAIEIEPDFAEAYAALARSYHFLASIGYPQFYPPGKQAAQKALEIDENNANAHGALAFILHQYDWDRHGAETHYRRAIALGPGLQHHHGYAFYLSERGRHAEAIAEIRKAEDLEPLSLSVKNNVALVYALAGEYERAELQLRHVLDLAPGRVVAKSNLAQVHMLLGRYGSAISALEALRNDRQGEAATAWGYVDVGPSLALGYARAGEKQKAERLLEELEREDDGKGAFAYFMARAYGAAGNYDAAFRWLNDACERHAMQVLSVNVDPFLEGLRTDERFDEVRRRLHLR